MRLLRFSSISCRCSTQSNPRSARTKRPTATRGQYHCHPLGTPGPAGGSDEVAEDMFASSASGAGRGPKQDPRMHLVILPAIASGLNPRLLLLLRALSRDAADFFPRLSFRRDGDEEVTPNRAWD